MTALITIKVIEGKMWAETKKSQKTAQCNIYIKDELWLLTIQHSFSRELKNLTAYTEKVSEYTQVPSEHH